MKEGINRLIVGIVIGIILIGVVSAELAIKNDETTFNFGNWFKHVLNQEFTIVGQDRLCDQNAKTTLYYSYGGTMNVNPSTYCSSGNALFDLFDQKWNKIAEYKSMNFVCGDNDGCLLEVYCCSHPECSSDTDCVSWVGTGSKCTTKSQVDPYMPLRDNNNNPISSYKYCSSSCTGSSITCYRIENNLCNPRTYDCSYSTYPNCPSTYPYTSLSQCQANMCTDTSWTPETSTVCSGTSFTQTSNCGNTKTAIGTKSCNIECPSGQTKCSDNVCRTSCETGTQTNISKAIPLTEEEFNEASPQTIVAAMCKVGGDCAERENNTVKCMYNDEITNINKNAVHLVKESSESNICFFIEDSFIGKLGGILPGLFFGKQYCAENQIGNPELYGTCRATETAGGICDFLRKAYFFNITGDKCTDGGITIIGGIILIFFLLSMMRGR